MKRSWLLGSIGVVSLVVVASLLAFFIPNSKSKDSSKSPRCFRASTFDHVQQSKGEDRQSDIDLNLQMFAIAAKLAKQNVCFIYKSIFLM